MQLHQLQYMSDIYTKLHEGLLFHGGPQVHHRLTYAQHFDEIVDEIMVLFHG